MQSFEGLVLDCAQDRRLDGARARILTSGRLYHRIGNIGNLTLSCQKMNSLNGRSQIEIAKPEMRLDQVVSGQVQEKHLWSEIILWTVK